jgi:hypothetical protein
VTRREKRTGYRRHTGFRASLTQIEIESIGGAKSLRSRAKPKSEAQTSTKAETVEVPAAAATPAGDVPEGYGDMTIAELKAASAEWDAAAIAAALAYEQEHGKRKGAIAALESALAQQGGES